MKTNNTEERWLPVVGREDAYEVSDKGRVRSITRVVVGKDNVAKTLEGCVLKQATTKDQDGHGGGGYKYVALCAKNKAPTKRVHRLVAKAFIPNPENKPTVNHKDGNPSNNELSNLEWATFSENNYHAYRSLGKIHGMKGKSGKNYPQDIKINQLDMDGKYIRSFYGAHEADRITGICFSGICSAIKGRRKSAGGYRWEKANA